MPSSRKPKPRIARPTVKPPDASDWRERVNLFAILLWLLDRKWLLDRERYRNKRLPLTHDKAARQAGLIWPIAPYRALGEAYVKALRREMEHHPQAFHSQWKGEKWARMTALHSHWNRAPRTPCSEHVYAYSDYASFLSPLDGWLTSLFTIMDEEVTDRLASVKTQKEREAIVAAALVRRKTNIVETLTEKERELNAVGSSLEEIFFFDALSPVLTTKVYFERNFRQRHAVGAGHKIRMDLSQSIRPQVRSIQEQIKAFSKKPAYKEFLTRERRDLSSSFPPAFDYLTDAAQYMSKHLIEALRIITPTPRDKQSRLERIEKEWRDSVDHLRMLFKGYDSVPDLCRNSGLKRLFDAMIVTASNIMKVRDTIKLIDHFYPLINEVLPHLFPTDLLFPNNTSPYPTTASALQRRYSRRD